MSSRRILIVDDNVDSADLAAELLQERGHVTCVAYGSRAAIAAAANFQPQIALLDIHLPTMSGYELATHLRAGALLGGCRFIAVTGSADEADRRESEAAGFYCHLVKPFGAEALFEAVDGHESDANCAPPQGWSLG
jgi:CheY-like chemotaxis protein